MLNFVLCDDNLQILNRLSKMLEAIFIKDNIDATVIFSSTEPNEIINYVCTNDVNVLFLDINLNNNISGCDIADSIRKKNKDIYFVFTTGHLEYALLAYKYKTFDYLSKPISMPRLEETVLRLREDIINSKSKYLKFNNKTIIKQNDINYIKKDGMKVIFCTDNRVYEIYSSFKQIGICLPDNFVRCHKSYIVNVDNIENFIFSKNIIYFKNNLSCMVGNKYKTKFMEVLKNGNFSNNLEYINQ